jgi:hypothetical protein
MKAVSAIAGGETANKMPTSARRGHILRLKAKCT